jgi:hypothetical protein
MLAVRKKRKGVMIEAYRETTARDYSSIYARIAGKLARGRELGQIVEPTIFDGRCIYEFFLDFKDDIPLSTLVE